MSIPNLDPQSPESIALEEIVRSMERTLLFATLARIGAFTTVLLFLAVAGRPLHQRGEIDVVYGEPSAWELWYSGSNAFEPEPQDDFFFMAEEAAGITTDPEEEPIPPKKKKKRRKKAGAGAPKIPGLTSFKKPRAPSGPTKAKAGGRTRL